MTFLSANVRVQLQDAIYGGHGRSVQVHDQVILDGGLLLMTDKTAQGGDQGLKVGVGNRVVRHAHDHDKLTIVFKGRTPKMPVFCLFLRCEFKRHSVWGEEPYHVVTVFG